MTTTFSSSSPRRHLYLVTPEMQEPAEPQVHPLLIARIEREITQQELADQIGLSVSTIKRAERGYGLNAYAREVLSDYFQQTPEALGLKRRKLRSRLYVRGGRTQ